MSIIISFAIGGSLLVLVFIKYIVQFNRFSDYLFNINDIDTLRKIGRMNSLDQKIFATIPFTKVHSTLLEKYKQTGDREYLQFDVKYMRCLKQMAILAGLLFFTYVFNSIIGI